MMHHLSPRPSLAALLSVLLLSALVIGSALGASQTPRVYLPLVLKAGTPPATSTRTITVTATPSATGTRAATTTPSATATTTPTVTITPTLTPSATATTTPTVTSTPTLTPSATATTTPTVTSTPTATATAISTRTPTATPNPARVGLRGEVLLRPVSQSTQAITQPVAYQILLDVSGSMSFNFTGEGWLNGRGVQCDLDINTFADPGAYRYPLAACQGGPSGYWNVTEERRIYVAKQAILTLIDALGPGDTMQIIRFNTDGNGPVDLNGDGQGNAADWSSDKAALSAAVLNAGRYNSNSYLTSGGSTNLQGITAAREMWLSPSAPIRTGNYRPVLIMLTDSVPWIFANWATNDARDVCQDIYNTFADQNLALTLTKNTPRCQIGYSEFYGQERPISASITQASALKRALQGLALYVVALGPMDPTGLDLISSTPSMTHLATTPGLVQPILQAIRGQIAAGSCITTVAPNWVSTIDGAHTPQGFGYPAGTFGYVQLYSQLGHTLPGVQLAIRHDPQTGLLTFSLPAASGLPPGTYQLGSALGYRGDDGWSRLYDAIENPATSDISSRVAITLAGPDGSTVTLDPVHLKLHGLQVCP